MEELSRASMVERYDFFVQSIYTVYLASIYINKIYINKIEIIFSCTLKSHSMKCLRYSRCFPIFHLVLLLLLVQQALALDSASLSNTSCHAVTSLPASAQCSYAKLHCSSDSTPYTITYYCASPITAHVLLAGSLLLLAALFAALGLSAADFLCPNLDTVSKVLRAGENVTGLTLLAFGNGLPDLFSTYSLVRAGAGALAVGELVGAALFITLVVVGAVALVRPFAVPRATFARDVAFFAFSVVVFDYFVLYKGAILNAACVALIALYALYVAIVLITQFLRDRRRAVRRSEQRARVQYSEDLTRTPSNTDLSLNLSLNPFDWASLNESDASSDSTASTGHSRVHNLGTYGYTTYDDITAAGPIQGDDNMVYDIHPEGAESPDDDEVANVFFVRPSLLDAVKLGSSKPEPAPPTVPLSADDRYSMHTVSQQQRPASEPVWGTTREQVLSTSWSAPFRDEPDTQEPESELLLGADRISYELVGSENAIEDIEGINTNRDFTEDYHEHQSRSPSLPPNPRMTLKRVISIFIPSLTGFSSKNFADKVLSVLVLPFSLILRLTVPVIAYQRFRSTSKQMHHIRRLKLENEAVNSDLGHIALHVRSLLFQKYSYDELWDERVLLTVQTFCASVVLSYTLFSENPWFWKIHVSVTVVFAFLFSRMVKRCFLPSLLWSGLITQRLVLALRVKLVLYVILSVLGFAVSICWISVIAEEVVTLMSFYSIVFGLSDAILGFTIFAIGNSLGDLIANLTIARMGFPRMAFAACFGGPLLNLLTGIGLSGLLLLPQSSLSTDEGIKVDFSLTLWISSISLLANLLFLLIAVPRNGWMVNRSIGIISVSIWTATTILNVLLEVFEKSVLYA